MAFERGVTEIEVRVDSELVVAQVKGKWKIKNDRLRQLAVRARGLLGKFDSWSGVLGVIEPSFLYRPLRSDRLGDARPAHLHRPLRSDRLGDPTD
jgi:hypothetical protein